MNKNLFSHTIILLMVLVNNCFNAQTSPDWELLNSTSSPVTGQTLTAVATMGYNSGNPLNNNVTSFSSPLTTTVILKNHQYSWSNPARIASNVIAGNSGNVIVPINQIGGPSNSWYTSNGALPGTGIDVATNQSFLINNYTAPLREHNIPPANRTYIGDLEISFNRPVNNPILHFAGLGGNAVNGLNFSTEFDLSSTNISNSSIAKLSGNAVLTVVNNQINNAATTMDGTVNAASGSVQVSGVGITTISFKMYLRGDKTGASPNDWASALTATSADGFTLSVSAVEDMGYIYIHKKAASEIGSPTFNYTLSPTTNGISSFDLNDTPAALNVTDLGASHGAGAGQLWAVANSTSFSATPRQNGAIYTRKAVESQWTQVTGVTNARSIDGIGLDSAVFTDANGHIFLLKNGVTTQIYTNTTGNSISATAYAVDVASDGTENGIVAVIGAGPNTNTTTLPIAMQNRKLYKYSGIGTTLANWSEYINAGNKVFRVDYQPATKEVYFVNFCTEADADQNVYKMSNASPSIATLSNVGPPPFTIFVAGTNGAAYNNRRDIAVGENGTIYSTFSVSSAPSDALYIFEYYAGSWHYNEQSRSFAVPTCGPGDQVWAVSKANAGIVEHTIFTRASNGNWLDDERVRVGTIGNSIMIPVPVGTYTVSEIANVNYKLSEISIIDPTNNSSSSIVSKNADINVSAGEVVHVTFQNTKINSVSVPSNCSENVLIDFGQGPDKFGPPLDGITAYHFKSTGINGNNTASAGDGYYLLAKSSIDFFSALNPNITNHTPNQPDGYFAVFNASYAKDDFFRRTLTDMVIGTKYRLSFWAANLSPGNELKPNAIMEIVDEGGVSMGQVATGNITGPDWKIYTFTFTATSTTGEVFLRNNGVGGSGNDIAIDDVTISASPTEIDEIQGETSICINSIQNPYQYTNATSGGTWSSDNVSLLTIDSATGSATANTNNEIGIVNITYTYSNPTTGCLSYAFYKVELKSCVCNNPITNVGTPNTTKHGITLLKRAGATNGNWPMSIPSAHTVLESNTQGFVPTRIAKAALVNITNPQEGMMVYDTTDKCLKIYSDGAWKCFNTQTCP